MSFDERLQKLGLELPGWREPAGTFVHGVEAGGMFYTAGHVPFRADGSLIIGKLGESLTVEQGVEAARWSALGVLTTLRHELGTLDRVERFVRVLATINATPDFGFHTPVANGASDVFVEVFGEAGKHARLAVGMSSLPFGIALEVEAIVALRPE